MKFVDEFILVFGDITLLQVVEIALGVAFLVAIWKKLSNFLVDQHERQRLRDAQLREALDGVHAYPTYRQQSIDIQRKLEDEIQVLREIQQDTSTRLEKMEETLNRRERNKLRDRLLQSYRFYTNPVSNPSHSWNRMESEAFWELFRDYEDAGGNGYMHTHVQPAMEDLEIVEIGENHGK